MSSSGVARQICVVTSSPTPRNCSKSHFKSGLAIHVTIRHDQMPIDYVFYIWPLLEEIEANNRLEILEPKTI